MFDFEEISWLKRMIRAFFMVWSEKGNSCESIIILFKPLNRKA
jgi:hypothetical protein